MNLLNEEGQRLKNKLQNRDEELRLNKNDLALEQSEEIEKLRAELDSVNKEIDLLKAKTRITRNKSGQMFINAIK